MTIFFNEEQPEKVLFSILSIRDGIEISINEEQSENAFVPIEERELGFSNNI